jgi:hypothetical protein
MVGKVSQSNQDRFKKAWNAHKGDETKVNTGGELPEIDFGVAQLVSIKIDQYKKGDNAGEYYYLAAATVISPKRAQLPDGSWVDIEGLRTQVGPEPLCDTPNASGKKKTFEDHMAFISNELRKLGLETKNLDINSVDDLKAICKTVADTAPYFKFRTWKGEKQTSGPYAGKEPLLNHDWQGLYKGDVEALGIGSDTGVHDNSAGVGPATSTNGEASHNEPEQQSPDVPFGDKWDDIAVDATSDDDTVSIPAQDTLTKNALKAGKTQEEIDNAEDWAQVAGWIREGNDDGSSTGSGVDYDALGDAADEEFEATGEGDKCAEVRALAEPLGIDPDTFSTWREVTDEIKVQSDDNDGDNGELVPEVGSPYPYKAMVMDTKTKKLVRAKKATDHEVIAVQAEARTVHLKDLTTQKVVNDPKTKKPLAVSWDELTTE